MFSLQHKVSTTDTVKFPFTQLVAIPYPLNIKCWSQINYFFKLNENMHNHVGRKMKSHVLKPTQFVATLHMVFMNISVQIYSFERFRALLLVPIHSLWWYKDCIRRLFIYLNLIHSFCELSTLRRRQSIEPAACSH